MPKIQGNSSQEKQKKEDLSPEDVYIQRLQQEAERPQYTTFGDYSEMALQVSTVIPERIYLTRF